MRPVVYFVLGQLVAGVLLGAGFGPPCSAQVGHLLTDTHEPIYNQKYKYKQGLFTIGVGESLYVGRGNFTEGQLLRVSPFTGQAEVVYEGDNLCWIHYQWSEFSIVATDGFFCVRAEQCPSTGIWCFDGQVGQFVSPSALWWGGRIGERAAYFGPAPPSEPPHILLTDGTVEGTTVVPLPAPWDAPNRYAWEVATTEDLAWFRVSDSVTEERGWLSLDIDSNALTVVNPPVELHPLGFPYTPLAFAGRLWAVGRGPDGVEGIWSWDKNGEPALELGSEAFGQGAFEVELVGGRDGIVLSRGDGAHVFVGTDGVRRAHSLPFQIGESYSNWPLRVKLGDFRGTTVHLHGVHATRSYAQFDVLTGELRAAPKSYAWWVGHTDHAAVLVPSNGQGAFVSDATPGGLRQVAPVHLELEVYEEYQAAHGSAAAGLADSVYLRGDGSESLLGASFRMPWRISTEPSLTGPVWPEPLESADGVLGGFVRLGSDWLFASTSVWPSVRGWRTDGSSAGTEPFSSFANNIPPDDGLTTLDFLPCPQPVIWAALKGPQTTMVRRINDDGEQEGMLFGAASIGEDGPIAAIDDRIIWRFFLPAGPGGSLVALAQQVNVKTAEFSALMAPGQPLFGSNVESIQAVGDVLLWISRPDATSAQLMRLSYGAPQPEIVALRPDGAAPTAVEAYVAVDGAGSTGSAGSATWVAARYETEPSSAWFAWTDDGPIIEVFAPADGAPVDVTRAVLSGSHLYFAGRIESQWWLWGLSTESAELTALLPFGATLDDDEWQDAAAVPGGVVFGHSDSSEPQALWVAGANVGPPGPLLDEDGSLGAVQPRHLVSAGDWAYFSSVTASTGREMWRTDGTSAGTKLAVEHVPGPASGVPEDMATPVPTDGGVLYAPQLPYVGREPYVLCHACSIEKRCGSAGESREHDPCGVCDLSAPTQWTRLSIAECAPFLFDVTPAQITAGDYAEFVPRGSFGAEDVPVTVQWPDATIGGARWLEPDQIALGARAPWVAGWSDIAVTIHAADGDYTVALSDAVEVIGSPPCDPDAPGCKCESELDCADIDWCTYEVCNVGACEVLPRISCCPTPALCQSCKGKGQTTGSDSFDVTDVQCGILLTLWLLQDDDTAGPSCQTWPLDRLDLNCDSAINVTDLVLQITKLLGGAMPLEVDQNQNGCVDACQ